MSEKNNKSMVDDILNGMSENELLKFVPAYAELKSKYKNIESVLEAAKEVQKAMLPRGAPKFKGHDIHFAFRPYYKISGDYINFTRTPEGELGIVLADVSGKGLEAALISPILHGAVMSQDYSKSLSDRTKHINEVMYKSTQAGKYATLINGVLNEEGFRWCNAGHEPLLLYSNKKVYEVKEESEIIGNRNLPIGVAKKIEYDENFISLEKEQILLGFTDGVTDTAGLRGLKKIRRGFRETHKSPSKIIIERIEEDLDSMDQMDDQTLFIVKTL